MAGITSVTFTYPLDIVRTRLSIQSASFAELGEKPKKLPGMWQTMGKMYRTEGGIRALYRGIVPTVAGVAPYVCGSRGGRRVARSQNMANSRRRSA
jgi:solute carrier family 25 phosphate transporter 23/24/25/41